jgi:alpha-amylase
MKSRTIFVAALIGAIASIATACGSYSINLPSYSIAVQGVRVTPQTVQLAAVGETKQLSATVAPLDASDRSVTWESSDPTVVSVDGNGRVTAKAVGAGVFVTAFTHDGNFQSSAVISVQP